MGKFGRLSVVILVALSVLFCLGNFLLHFLVIDASVFWFSRKSEPSGEENLWWSMDVPQSMRDRLTAKHTQFDVTKCNIHSCFDITRCSSWNFDINAFQSVSLPHVATRAGQSSWYSIEFLELLGTVQKQVIAKAPSSEGPGAADSCIVIPGIDLLDENRNLQLGKKRESSLSPPKNSLVFNLIPNATRGYFHSSLGYAMVASSGLLLSKYRSSFDISIPFYVLQPVANRDEKLSVRTNILLITASEDDVATGMQRTTELKLCSDDVNHITHRCKKSPKDDEYQTALLLVDEMFNSEFCLLPERSWYRQPDLSSALLAGCIPVVTCDAFVLPFPEVIDWKSTALLYYGRSKSEVRELIREIKIDHINRLRQNGRQVYDAYFSGLELLVQTVFEIIYRRFDPLFNLKPSLTSSRGGVHDVKDQTPVNIQDQKTLDWNSLFISNMRFMRHYTEQQLEQEKFTAVVLTHDRVACLFDIVQTLMMVPACEKVIVVWNNQERQSPHQTQWPHVNKPLKVINMAANKLNNRFLPFKDISSDAVLSLDDDMNSITVGEIMNAFRVWQLNPSRLVGFFGWHHLLENDSVETASGAGSEKLSAISTALMFYHQAFAQLFVDHSNEDLFEWIERHHNCEDIAFNFFVSNLTSLAPLQVKRNQEISAKSFCDMNKSDNPQPKSKNTCFQYLRNYYNGNPLKTTNFFVENMRRETFMFEEVEEEKR